VICSKVVLGFAVCLLASVSMARSAELPSKSASPPSAAAPAKTCMVNGTPGLMAGDSGVCVKVSGYVSGQIAGGTLSKSQTLIYH